MNGIYAIFYKSEKNPYIFQDQENGTIHNATFLHKKDAEKIAQKMGKDFSVKVYIK